MKLVKRVSIGIQVGVAFAVVYSIIAAMVFHFRGPMAAERIHATLRQVVLTYFLAGIIGGAAAGVALPLARYRGGSSLVGIVAALPLFMLVMFLVAQDVPIFPHQFVMACIGAILVGGLGGLLATRK